MKKRLRLTAPIALIFLSLFTIHYSLSSTSASAAEVTWKSTNQATIEWDAVSTFDDGSALPAGSTVQYDTFTRGVQDPVTTYIRAITVTAPPATLTFEIEGRYFIGVQAIRLINGVIEPASNSSISWSDNPAVAQGGAPFGISYYKKLRNPGGLR